MNRRDAIKFTALSFGAVIGQSISGSIFAQTLKLFNEDIGKLKLKHFTQDQFEMLTAIIDIYIPETESPSASQVGVHFLMDSIVAEVFPEHDKIGYTTIFESLNAHLRIINFLSLNATDQLATLNQILNDAASDDAKKQAAQAIRSFSIDLYLATEKISKEFQNYVPVPGYYDPCINVSEANNLRWSI